MYCSHWCGAKSSTRSTRNNVHVWTNQLANTARLRYSMVRSLVNGDFSSHKNPGHLNCRVRKWKFRTRPFNMVTLSCMVAFMFLIGHSGSKRIVSPLYLESPCCGCSGTKLPERVIILATTHTFEGLLGPKPNGKMSLYHVNICEV